MTDVRSAVAAVTAQIQARSAQSRETYLARIEQAIGSTGGTPAVSRAGLGCANLAHGMAACGPEGKLALRTASRPNVAIVTSYNDMLSAHQPFETYPRQLKQAVQAAGGVAQVAGGTPAMCDGITQGRAGMELSLFSRDVIALSTAVALSHDMFDGTLMLGVCDKIVPGLVIGALSFGHLPTIFVPAGPMTSGLPNKEKARVRQLYAEGKVGREALLEAESASYHGPGTCTFYGTANSNQMLMEIMGLHLPGASFVNPGTPMREALTDAAGARIVQLAAQGQEYTPAGRVVDEKSVVNAVVGLLATGGSTNHTMHLVAMAGAAGVRLTWSDIAALSAEVPQLARVYPNGSADVNHFQAAGGMGFLIGTLLDGGLLHEDVLTVAGPGLSRYREEPTLESGSLTWRAGPAESLDPAVLRPATAPFAEDGGLRVVEGNLGRAVVKVSAVAPEHRVVTASARVFDDQEGFLEAFARGELDGDLVAVLRYQGPRALGMPELHKLTPALGVLQDRGHRVALVTDGRMSGASGKVLSAIHLTPEAAAGGALSRVRDGDVVTVDADDCSVRVHLSDAELAARTPTGAAPTPEQWVGTGRELFGAFRAVVGPADLGASVFDVGTPVAPAPAAPGDRDVQEDLSWAR